MAKKSKNRRVKISSPSYVRKTWESRDRKSGIVTTKCKWRLRYYATDRRGERKQFERGGFYTKTQAEAYFQREVVPALEAGFASVEEWKEARYNERSKAKELEALRNTTLTEWKDQYCSVHLIHLRPRTREQTLSQINRAIAHWGKDKKVAGLKTADVSSFVAMPTKNGDPSSDTKRGRLLVARRFLRAAQAMGIMEKDICENLKLPKAGKGRERFLSVSEVHSLLMALGDHERIDRADRSGPYLQALAALAVYTGARKDEIVHLEWRDIYRADGITFVDIHQKTKWRWRPKGEKPRKIAAHPDMSSYLDRYVENRRQEIRQIEWEIECLKKWRDELPLDESEDQLVRLLRGYDRPPSANVLIAKSEGVLKCLKLQEASSLVFPNEVGERMTETPKGFKATLESLGIYEKGMGLHLLRHTFASHLVMSGAEIAAVKEIMGHQDIKTTMRYAHLAPGHSAEKGLLVPNFSDPVRARKGQSGPAKVLDVLTGTEGSR